MKIKPLEQKFWEKVDRRSDEDCWNWKASILKSGYGNLRIKCADGEYRTHTSHRLSWEINRGNIPCGMWVLHTCDNRACVNPSHLFLGSQQDNIRDCVVKNRNFVPKARKGVENERSKLDDYVVKIIRYVGNRVSADELAREFGTCKTNIYAIRKYETWKHVEVIQ